jgi:hypothetical protein
MCIPLPIHTAPPHHHCYYLRKKGIRVLRYIVESSGCKTWSVASKEDFENRVLGRIFKLKRENCIVRISIICSTQWGEVHTKFC